MAARLRQFLHVVSIEYNGLGRIVSGPTVGLRISAARKDGCCIRQERKKISKIHLEICRLMLLPMK